MIKLLIPKADEQPYLVLQRALSDATRKVVLHLGTNKLNPTEVTKAYLQLAAATAAHGEIPVDQACSAFETLYAAEQEALEKLLESQDAPVVGRIVPKEEEPADG